MSETPQRMSWSIRAAPGETNSLVQVTPLRVNSTCKVIFIVERRWS